jgi:acetyltransferase
VRAADGTEYRIRPITPDDAERERAFIAGLSAESRYRRFMHALAEASPAFIEQLVHIDRHLHMALVAVSGDGPDERIVGVARYAADEGGIDCEFAVVVADQWQGRGLGTTLARLLFDYAASQGFRMIYGIVQADNVRMLELARFLGLEVEPPRPRQDTVRAWRLLN